MSSETGTYTESFVWVLLTALLTWVFFGGYAIMGIASSVFLTNLYFILLIMIAVVLQFMLDALDQNRALNVLLLAVLFGILGLAFYILGFVSLIVPALGIFFFPFSALVAEKIVAQLPI